MNDFRYMKIAIASILGLGIVLSVVGGMGVARSQAPASPSAKVYAPTKDQALQLQVAPKDASLAQAQLQRAQQAFQQALAQLDSVAGEVKKANGWPADVQFSPDTLTFSAPPTPPTLPAQGKKPEETP